METRKAEVIDNIPFELDVAKVLKNMRFHGDPARFAGGVREMIDIVEPVARPKVLYKIACVDRENSDSLEIDGVSFTSPLLQDNLAKTDTVFVCVATTGTEVETIREPDDVMMRFCLDTIKNMILFSTARYLQNYLTQHFGLESVTSMNPGEMEAFPIDQQRKIFAILGDVEGMIGVKLTGNCGLIPTKSTSGIYFSTDTGFVGCRLCTQKKCTGRRAAYDPELARKYHGR